MFNIVVNDVYYQTGALLIGIYTRFWMRFCDHEMILFLCFCSE